MTRKEKANEPKAGAGCWKARRMDIQWPGKSEGEMVEAIGIYNTVAGEFKLHECVGEAMDSFIEDNPDEDADELESIYWREAEDWARRHNANGW